MRISTVLLAVVLLAACGSEAELDDSDVSSTTQADGSSTTTTDLEGPGFAVPDDVVEAAIDEAAEDTEFDAESLQVVSAQEVVWSDGSLGCPQEGQSYIQVLTDGYWVILESPGGELDYRANLEGEFQRCDDGRPPVSTPADR